MLLPGIRCWDHGVVADQYRPRDGLQAVRVAPVHDAWLNVDDRPNRIGNQDHRILAHPEPKTEQTRERPTGEKHAACGPVSGRIVPQKPDGDRNLQCSYHLRGQREGEDLTATAGASQLAAAW